MKSPAQWQPTDVKPPESDLRPTSERKREEKGQGKKKANHFDQWESIQATIYYTHDAVVYTYDQGYSIHFTVTE